MMAVTKVYSVQVIGGAAVLSICCSFLGKLAALINTIPGPVIGGISFLLYGMIGTSGLRMLVDGQVDYGKSRNLTLTSVVFVGGTFRYCPASGRCGADRYGACLRGGYDSQPGILRSGQAETDQ